MEGGDQNTCGLAAEKVPYEDFVSQNRCDEYEHKVPAPFHEGH